MQLRVVRFAGVGFREHHELGLCVPTSDAQTVRVMYKDRDVECPFDSLTMADVVNVQSLTCKAYVMYTVERDMACLRAKCYDAYYHEVSHHTEPIARCTCACARVIHVSRVRVRAHAGLC
jgi:hypothetical protein